MPDYGAWVTLPRILKSQARVNFFHRDEFDDYFVSLRGKNPDHVVTALRELSAFFRDCANEMDQRRAA